MFGCVDRENYTHLHMVSNITYNITHDQLQALIFFHKIQLNTIMILCTCLHTSVGYMKISQHFYH
ncbi:hypothetical protein Hanom_Chr09g00812911 [Helianthus anomalus]